MTDDRLDYHAYKRCDDPEHWQLFYIGTERTQNAARISVLQCKSELDAQKAKAHSEYLRNCKAWLL
jgi:hypothetical protein